jgi:Flp pilus assembly protein TadD
LDGRVTMAIAALDAGNTVGALNLLEARLRVAPSDTEALYYYGTTQMRAGNLRGAESTWRRLILLRPYHVRAHMYLGDVYARLGRSAEARRAWDRAGALQQAQQHR